MSDQITETAFDVRIYADAESLPFVVAKLEDLLDTFKRSGEVIDHKYLADEDYLEGLEGVISGTD